MACFAALSACSLFVSLDGLSGGSGDGGIVADGSTPFDGGDGSPTSDASTVADGAFLDDFNRPDNALLGNGWIEKSSDAFSLSNGSVLRSEAGALDYPDNMVYRPPGEDVQDSTISMELTFAQNVAGFPQIHSRIQQNSVGAPGIDDSYLLYMDFGNPKLAHVARSRGAENLSDLSNTQLGTPMVVGDRYRLTLKVAGRNSVSLTGTVEHFVSGSWVMIAQVAAIDTDPSRLDDAGSTGFSGSIGDTDPYSLDNFTRVSP